MRTAPVLRLAAAFAVVPLVVSAVYLTLWQRDYTRVGDLAMTEMVTRDVGRYAVEIGPFSRDGWHHPGPALYYLLAVPYRLLGSRTSAMDVGALLITGASVVGMAVVARRRGGMALALITLVGCALLMRTLGPDEVRLPWNPYVTVLPYALLVFLTWALTCRDRWALPAAVVVASFVAQTHIGYVALALPLVAFGALWLLVATVRRRRDDPAADGLRGLVVPGLVAAGAAALMWLPPLVEQVTNDPGNLEAALRWFREGGSLNEAARGWRTGWRLVMGQYGLPPEWLFGEREPQFTNEPAYVYEPLLPVLLFVVAGSGYLLWRRRLEGSGRLAAVWAVATVVGIVATARTVGPVYEYRVGWARALGMVAGVMVAWAGWTALSSWRPAVERRVLLPVSLAVLVVLAAVGSVAHVRVGRRQPEASARADALVSDVVEGLPPGDGPVVVDGSGFDGSVCGAAMVLQLERQGVDARMPAGDTAAGAHRMDDGGRTRAELVVTAGAAIPKLAASQDVTMLAFDGDMTVEEIRDEVGAGGTVADGVGAAVFLVEET